MQVSGRILVLTTFGIALAMAGGAWWYNYNQSRLSAQFWGASAAKLIVGKDKVEFLELKPPRSEADVRDTVKNLRSGGNVIRRVDLTGKPGLVHLRHALTYDDNYFWNAIGNGSQDWGWTRALLFTSGNRELVILFHDNFARLGRVADDGSIFALPCPKLGPVIIDYLSQPDVAAIPPS